MASELRIMELKGGQFVTEQGVRTLVVDNEERIRFFLQETLVHSPLAAKGEAGSFRPAPHPERARRELSVQGVATA
jgi:hypothetical protein